MRGIAFLFGLGLPVMVAGCGQSPAHEGDNVASNPTQAAPAIPSAAGSGFQPLQSDQVKDAMYRALKSGETQRWQDGAWSGYAVPGPPGKSGCRAIRYIVDQRPEVPFESITACEAN